MTTSPHDLPILPNRGGLLLTEEETTRYHNLRSQLEAGLKLPSESARWYGSLWVQEEGGQIHQPHRHQPPAADLPITRIEDAIIPTERLIPWGKRVSPSFIEGVLSIEERLGINADYLMACMAFETGRRFSASVRNPRSSATGLIQFMDSTARWLGTTTKRLAAMTPEAQLTYVFAYFNRMRRRSQKAAENWTLSDVYMAILWPAAIGKPESFPLFVNNVNRFNDSYDVNRGLDLDRDGIITKKEATAKVQAMLDEGLREQNVLRIKD